MAVWCCGFCTIDWSVGWTGIGGAGTVVRIEPQASPPPTAPHAAKLTVAYLAAAAAATDAKNTGLTADTGGQPNGGGGQPNQAGEAESGVAQLMAMGFEQPAVEAMLDAAGGDVESALQLLLGAS